MKKMPKLWPRDKRLNQWEWFAFLIDIYRVFPRLIFLVSCIGLWDILVWYRLVLEPVERTTEVTAFVSVITAAWVKLMDYYMQRGVDWSKRMQINGGEAHVDSSINITQS